MPTIPTMVSALLGYLSNTDTGKKAKSELTEATWNWIQPLFLKDDEVVKKIESGEAKEEDVETVKSELVKKVETSKELELQLQSFFDQIQQRQLEEMGGMNVNISAQKVANVKTNNGVISF